MTRYLLVLLIGLAIIALISALWIRHTTIDYRMSMMTIYAEQMVDRITNVDDGTRELPREGMIGGGTNPPKLDIKPQLYITNLKGEVLNKNQMGPPLLAIEKNVLNSSETKQTIKLANGIEETFYIVKKKVKVDKKQLGWVVVMESEKNMTHTNQALGQLAILIGALALIGLGAIYYLTSRLTKPIQQVANAAKMVQEGNYALDLPDDSPEAEVHDLVQSFKEMTGRLEQLESMRTELLAGVTHELKTPVTAIDGLLQALKDGVVAGDEAREFVQMAMIETKKMKTMVGDLLAFNSFAVNAIPIKLEARDINQFMQDTIAQWAITQENAAVKIDCRPLSQEESIFVDPVRFQQIFTNLFTNAAQAMKDQGHIHVRLESTSTAIAIYVRDEGPGIPLAEQQLIFDRFYRGEDKKYMIRGLGLGLPLSKMMAQSINGDLQLVKSDETGTEFVLKLYK